MQSGQPPSQNLETHRGRYNHKPEESPDIVKELSPRPLVKPAEAMKFWDTIFPQAITKSESESPEEPKNRSRVAAARRVGKMYMSSLKPAVGAIKLIPENDYITPVLGAVHILPESTNKFVARTRKEILGGFDDLDLIFSEVEFFIEAFPRDENIRNASVDLVVAILSAI
ncbi:hypothetical protein F5Y11DRAFT_350612 [Daldinia sp. FL1419]|nr:hypothetical protein F5Y11DRAFT_350612 [Daldinia sp. FL1419]